MADTTRGIVLSPQDLTLPEWPKLAAQAGLNTLALHVLGGPPSHLVAFMATEDGQRFLRDTATYGLNVEYELHAMSELLPRALFAEAPRMFRMDEKGERTPDANLCCNSDAALAEVGRQAARLARALPPTTHRYYLWPDDGAPWCHCERCRELPPSDQSLTVANHVLRAIRTIDTDARAAWLSYDNTLDPPEQVRPEPGIFLEYAPIRRSYEFAIDDPACAVNAAHVAQLDRALEVLGTDGAQVLEYWLDASRFSGWKRPAVKLPFNAEVFERDVRFYVGRGFERVTSFGVSLDAEYVRLYGLPPIADYGCILSRWISPRQGA